jgi:hypothetical protein
MGQSHCNYQPFHYNSQNFDIIFSGGRPKRLECTLINKECHVACILEFKKTSLDFSCMCRGMDNLHMLCNFLYMWKFLTTPLSPPQFMLIKVTFHTLMTLPTWTMFLVLANSPQISTWKYDFDLQGTFMEKMIQVHQMLKNVFLICQIFMISSNR